MKKEINMTNFQLQYLDKQGNHLDVNQFENLTDAISMANQEKDWVDHFKIYGMDQKLTSVKTANGELEWRGISGTG